MDLVNFGSAPPEGRNILFGVHPISSGICLDKFGPKTIREISSKPDTVWHEFEHKILSKYSTVS